MMDTLVLDTLVLVKSAKSVMVVSTKLVAGQVGTGRLAAEQIGAG